jgi:hypothetical protein
MIVTMNITKLDASLYEVRLEDGGVEMFDATVYGSVSEAIFETGRDIPHELAGFVHLYYGALSFGTVSVHRLQTQATIIADEIMQLVAAVHRDEDERS